MEEIVSLESQAAPAPSAERAGFAITYVRRAIDVQFPIDEDVTEVEQGGDEALYE